MVINNLEEPYLDLFYEYLQFKESRVSKQGFQTLKRSTKRFLAWLQLKKLSPFKITVNDAINYRKEMAEKIDRNGENLSVGTVINCLKTARAFYRWLVLCEKIQSNPFDVIKNPRLPRHISRNVLTESQMCCLLDKLREWYLIKNKTHAKQRYKCHVLAELLYSTGLRIFEAADLDEENLDFDRQVVYVKSGKGGKSRVAFLNAYSIQIIKQYLVVRAKVKLPGFRSTTKKLFNLCSERLAKVMNRELALVCKELDIPIITCHGFRHSLGTHLLRNGCDMRYIQIILGHDSLTSTQIYTQVDKQDLRNVIDEFHPRKYKVC